MSAPAATPTLAELWADLRAAEADCTAKFKAFDANPSSAELEQAWLEAEGTEYMLRLRYRRAVNRSREA